MIALNLYTTHVCKALFNIVSAFTWLWKWTWHLLAIFLTFTYFTTPKPSRQRHILTPIGAATSQMKIWATPTAFRGNSLLLCCFCCIRHWTAYLQLKSKAHKRLWGVSSRVQQELSFVLRISLKQTHTGMDSEFMLQRKHASFLKSWVALGSAEGPQVCNRYIEDAHTCNWHVVRKRSQENCSRSQKGDLSYDIYHWHLSEVCYEYKQLASNEKWAFSALEWSTKLKLHCAIGKWPHVTEFSVAQHTVPRPKHLPLVKNSIVLHLWRVWEVF